MKNILLACLLLFSTVNDSYAQCFANATPQSSSCAGSCTGSWFIAFSTNNFPISLSVNGGPPFQVTSAWQQGGLCPGVYDFVAIDSNGDTCTGSTTIIIPQSPGPSANVNVVNATCAGCQDGAAILNVTGGTPPYSYLWSNGSTTQSMNNLSIGNYTVSITDANGCSNAISFIIGIGNNGFYALSGEIYLDLNFNGIKDSGEQGVSNQIVDILPVGLNSYTSSSGVYLAIVPPGVYDVNYQTQAGWNLTSSPSTYNNISVATSSVSGLDFGVYPDSTFASGNAYLCSNVPRCLWDVPYYIYANNNGYTNLNGSISFTYDTSQVYISSSIPPTTFIGNTLTYDFTNLAPGQSYGMTVTLNEPAAGTLLNLTTVLNATDVFNNTISDTTLLNQTVTCSFDPNDKAVLPAGVGGANYVEMDTELNYLIRFQNTGNDTAFKVVIVDTLDLNLDITTFTIIGSSHAVTSTIDSNRELQFIFTNILLPDSIVDETGSHGFVAYQIESLPGIPDPTAVNNTAYIYFDQNSPVQTNTTLTTFSNNFLGIFEPNNTSCFELFPNPMNESATLHWKGKGYSDFRISISDLSGRTVFQPVQMVSNALIIHKNDLPSGVYFLEARPVNGGKPEFLRLVIY